MSRLGVYFLRFLVIVAGFLAACLGASAFLHLLILGGLQWTPDEAAFVAGSFLFSVPFVAVFVAYFAFVPAMLVILLTEFLGRRGWLFFALAGGVAGLAVAFLSRFASADEPRAFDPATIGLALFATGMVGGICYWLVAGRNAGRWLWEDAPLSAPEP